MSPREAQGRGSGMLGCFGDSSGYPRRAKPPSLPHPKPRSRGTGGWGAGSVLRVTGVAAQGTSSQLWNGLDHDVPGPAAPCDGSPRAPQSVNIRRLPPGSHARHPPLSPPATSQSRSISRPPPGPPTLCPNPRPPVGPS